MGLSKNNTEFSRYIERRKNFVERIKQRYPDITHGNILLLANFENERYRFRQESSFYYLTGITEPGVALMIDLQGRSTLYVPDCADIRARWACMQIEYSQKDAERIGVDRIEPLGEKLQGYTIGKFCQPSDYSNLIHEIKNIVSQKMPLFMFYPQHQTDQYIEQRLVVCQLFTWIEGLQLSIQDVSSIVAQMRRKKELSEIELLYKAVEITALAQEAAAQSIAPQITEAEVQASLEFMFTGAHASAAFPSIVATGRNATILHYTSNKGLLEAGDLVVVDIGAEYEYYCADITRTYPVGGRFTMRQKELYTIVLDTQEYIATVGQPGYWLSNNQDPKRSLNHLAKAYLEKYGYGHYFPHGIGHYLGLDVHDVDAQVQEPLQIGDVFTIEPGIYIPEEGIGIRIEDNYWMTENGLLCLSDYIPKTVQDIEVLMQDNA